MRNTRSPINIKRFEKKKENKEKGEWNTATKRNRKSFTTIRRAIRPVPDIERERKRTKIFSFSLSRSAIPQDLVEKTFPGYNLRIYRDERARSIVNSRLMEWNSHRDRRFHLWIFFSTLAMRVEREGCSFLSFSPFFLSFFLSLSFRHFSFREIVKSAPMLALFSSCNLWSAGLNSTSPLFFSLSVFFSPSFHRFLPLHGFHPSFARYFLLQFYPLFLPFSTRWEKVPRTTVFSRFAIRRALECVGSNNTVLGSRYRRSRRSSPRIFLDIVSAFRAKVLTLSQWFRSREFSKRRELVTGN